MGNIIQIKRGLTIPEKNGLNPYELGFVVNNTYREQDEKVKKNSDSSAGYLYIGDLGEITEDGKLVYQPFKIKAGYADKAGEAQTAQTAQTAQSAERAGEADQAEQAGRAEQADQADQALCLYDSNNKQLFSAGNSGEPVYFSNGIPVACDLVERANMASSLKLSQDANSFIEFKGETKNDNTFTKINIQTYGQPYSGSMNQSQWSYSFKHGVLSAPMLAVAIDSWGAGSTAPGDTWYVSDSNSNYYYPPESGQLYFLVPENSSGWVQATPYIYIPKS